MNISYYPKLSFYQQKHILQYLFQAFKEYEVPFHYGAGVENRLVVETWGFNDHLLLFLNPHEEYYKSPSRYTSSTAARKLTVLEVIKHFFPSALNTELYAIIQQILNSKRKEVTAYVEAFSPKLQHLHRPLFTPDTKPEDVPDDLLGKFGIYKGYDPKWAFSCLSGRKKKNRIKDKSYNSNHVMEGCIYG